MQNGTEIYYRGYKKQYGSQRTHLLWLTDDIDYAKEYGDTVEEYVLDASKLKCASLYKMDEFSEEGEIDYLDGPTKEEARLALKAGYNCYAFEANSYSSECLCLWDKSPIISRRVLSDEEVEELINGEYINENIVSELDNGGFVATTEWMKRRYDEMNAKLFNGKLGNCYFDIPTTGKGMKGKRLGSFCLKGRGLKFNRHDRRLYFQEYYGADKQYINRNNFFSLCRPLISLNGNIISTEKSSLSTLVHEMCHYYTYMNGYVPMQGHGLEFKNIANYVTAKANGEIFPIQTYASKEESAETEWTDEIKTQKEKRKNNKLARRTIVVVFKANGQIRLINAANQSLINRIVEIESYKKQGEQACLKIVKSTDPVLKEKLDSKGFNSDMTSKYSFWDLEKWPEIKEFIKNYDGWEVIYNNIVREGLNKMSKNLNNDVVEISPNMDLSNTDLLEAKKVVRNDEGKAVPEHCSCGGKIGVFIEGEPIYKCTACGKYYGTVPFHKKTTIKESELRKMISEAIVKVIKETLQ